MSGLGAASQRAGHSLQPAELGATLKAAEALEIVIEATPWPDVHRAWTLAQDSLRYPDAIYVAAAERHGTALLTADNQIERSGPRVGCQIITV